MGRTANAVRGLVVAGVTVTAMLTVPTSPAGADTPTPSYDVALGVSLVTGVGSSGGADYVNDLDAYAASIPGLQLDNLGCGGETTSTMVHGGHCTKFTTGSQLGDAEAFLEGHPGQVAFVTLDIGADDVLGCAPGGVIDVSCFENGLAQVEADLPTIVDGLRAAGPDVPIVGMTYYDPYLEFWLNGTSGPAAAKQSIGLVKQLNVVLTSDYQAEGITIASAYKQFGTNDFSDSASWDGETVPRNVATICSWTWMCTPGGPTIHANNTGYAELADAFEKVLVVPPTLGGAPPDAVVGQAYSFAFTVGGVPAAKVHHAGPLPKGLHLSKSGVLSGVPTRAGTYALAVSASDKGGSTSMSTSITVAAG